MTEERCEECGTAIVGYSSILVGSGDGPRRLLCSLCFNAEVARQHGLDGFENIQLDPVGIADCTGEKHEFHFQTMLFGDLVSLRAFEIHDGELGGYEFQVVGDPEEDLFTLLGRLIQKIRKRLSVRHLKVIHGHGLQITDGTVRGHIDWDDEEDGRVPMMVIDGQRISWDEFGQMVMAHEGWQFKMEIVDPSEDV